MLGKLSLESIPDPIVLTTLVGAVLGGLGVMALITKFKLWGYLWKGGSPRWITRRSA